VKRELERRFPPEFRNRIDEVVLFAPLTHDEVREIARHYLDSVKLTLMKSGKTIEVTDEALEMVVVRGYSMAYGARFLKRFIDEQIKLPISAQWKSGSHFDVKVKDGELVVEPAVAKMATPDDTLAYGDVA
jgi:ATP-dependent Clp protease ATP-binding subunit ClpA